MENESDTRMCFTCGENERYRGSSYCGKCQYALRLKSERKVMERKISRITAELTIKSLSSEIEELIEDLTEDDDGAKALYLRNRLSMQTKNLSYLALGLVGQK